VLHCNPILIHFSLPKELTADVEKQFFKTLACLKKSDPRIYDENTKFFQKKDSSEATSSKAKSAKEKPMFLRDYERKILLEKGGHISSDEEGNFFY
jgi:protein KRI1